MSLIKPMGTTQISVLGMVVMFAGADEPMDWMICDGRALDRAAYLPLFNLIGTTYGAGDGVGTFNIPDLRGRCAMGTGTGVTGEGGVTGTARSLGQKFGYETHTLTQAQMPPHTHSYQADTVANDASISLLGSGNRITAQPTTATGSAGNGQAHPNVGPVAVINYLIRVQV